MDITLSPKLQAFVDQKLSEGEYASPLHVIEAALTSLQRQNEFGDFAPGVLDGLLAEGQADLDHGRVREGAGVFRELDARSAARRGRPRLM